jgi:hypothetical protein
MVVNIVVVIAIVVVIIITIVVVTTVIFKVLIVVVFRILIVVVLIAIFVVLFTMVLVAILITTVEIIEVVFSHSRCNVHSNVCLIIRFLSLVILVVVVKYLWLQMQCKDVLVCSVIFVEKLDI